MLPALIQFASASSACICFTAVYPILALFLELFLASLQNICTSSKILRPTKNCYSEYYVTELDSILYLSIWIAGCIISCMYILLYDIHFLSNYRSKCTDSYFKTFSGIVVYSTIVLYSAYKSVDEESKRIHLRPPTDNQNQNIELGAKF